MLLPYLSLTILLVMFTKLHLILFDLSLLYLLMLRLIVVLSRIFIRVLGSLYPFFILSFSILTSSFPNLRS